MSRVYAVPYTGTLTTAGGNADLYELLPADDKPIALIGLVLAQSTEVGDAAEENLQLSIIRMGATVTSGNGTSVTPVPTDPNDAAAGLAAEANGATVATTSGTTTTVDEFAWNIRNTPYERWWPDDECAIKAIQGQALLVRCNSTPADDITIAMTAYVREF